jgi:hypothetical protein
MKLIISVNILSGDTPGKRHVHALLHKEYETGLVPMVGMEIEDPAWNQSRAIRSVTINPEEDYYYVYAGDDIGQDNLQCEQLEQAYHAHGWRRPIA